MAGAFEIVMSERKALADKIINMMKQGDFFHNTSEWDKAALRPQKSSLKSLVTDMYNWATTFTVNH